MIPCEWVGVSGWVGVERDGEDRWREGRECLERERRGLWKESFKYRICEERWME